MPISVLASMHFGASYHLAYAGGRRSLREHPLALVVVPAALLVACASVALLAVARTADAALPLLRLMLVSVFTLTGWHYIKQGFGVAMLSIRARGLAMSRFEVLILRYSLYPVWLYQVTNIYGHESQATYRGFDTSVAVLPHGADNALRAIAVAAAVVAGVVIVSLARRLRGFPPAGLWATYLTAVLWFVAPPNYISAGIVIGGLHGLQYLACAHRAEVDRAVEGGQDRVAHWWLCVFGGAAAGGLLLGTFLPNLLDNANVTSTTPGLLGTLLFVIMNLHHYAIDATIWRAGGEHVRRISRGPAVPAMEPTRPAPSEPVPSFV